MYKNNNIADEKEASRQEVEVAAAKVPEEKPTVAQISEGLSEAAEGREAGFEEQAEESAERYPDLAGALRSLEKKGRALVAAFRERIGMSNAAETKELTYGPGAIDKAYEIMDDQERLETMEALVESAKAQGQKLGTAEMAKAWNMLGMSEAGRNDQIDQHMARMEQTMSEVGDDKVAERTGTRKAWDDALRKRSGRYVHLDRAPVEAVVDSTKAMEWVKSQERQGLPTEASEQLDRLSRVLEMHQGTLGQDQAAEAYALYRKLIDESADYRTEISGIPSENSNRSMLGDIPATVGISDREESGVVTEKAFMERFTGQVAEVVPAADDAIAA